MPGVETGTIIALSISGGLTIVSTALSYFTRPKIKSPEDTVNKFDRNITDPNEFLPIVYGEARLGINRVFVETWPKNINNLIGVGSICHGEIDDITKVWIDNEVLIAKDNDVGKLEVVKTYDAHAHFAIRMGTDTQKVFNFVREEAAGWTKEHRGRGIAAIAMRLKWSQNLFPSGIPNITILVRGQKVRDPRDLADPPNATQAEWDALTPAWSDNPSLCALDYLMSSRYGIGAPALRVDFQSFCDIGNYCDIIINSGNLIEAPKACKAELIKSRTNLTLNSTYYYKYSLCSETSDGYYAILFESELSPISSAMSITSDKGRVRLTDVAVSGDSSITHRKIYRSLTPTGDYHYIGMLDDNTSTTFIDNMSDKDALLGNIHAPVGGGTNPTVACTATFTNLTGNLTASKLYRYKVTFVNSLNQETEAGNASNRIKTNAEYRAIYLTNIPIGSDENITKRKIYRTTGYNVTDAIPSYKLVYTINDNTTSAWEDIIADASLTTVAPSAPTAYAGSFKIAQCNGVVDTSKEVDANIEEILSSCRGHIYYAGGRYKVSVRRVVTPEILKLTEDNIIGDWEFSLPGFKEMSNVVSAEWRNPYENWQFEPFIWPKAGATNQYLIDDNNFENIKEIKLPFTTKKKQAKLMAQIIRKESRQQTRCQVTVKEEGLNYEYDSLVCITHPTPGWVDKLFWVDEVGILQSGNVRIAFTEYDSTSYDLETIDQDTPDGDDTTLSDPRQPPPEVTGVEIIEELFLDGSVPNWRLKVTYTDPIDMFWDYSNVYVKTGSNSEYELYCKINRLSNGIFYIYPIEPLNTYYIKICSVSTLGVQQEIEDANEYVKIVSPPIPGAVFDLEIENRGSDDNVHGNTFKFRWGARSFFGADGNAKNNYAHQQVNALNENVQYLVEIRFKGIPDSVTIAGQKANDRPVRTVLQPSNKFEYTIENSIEDSKRLFSAFSLNPTHAYYKAYYGIPQRKIEISVTIINGWSVSSPIVVKKIVTNKAPDMLKQNGTTLIKPDVEPVFNGVEVKWSHPPGEYDLAYYMLLVAGDTTGNKTQSQIAEAFTATRYKTTTKYVLGNIIYPQDLNGHCYKCTQAGMSGGVVPTFTKPSIGNPHPVVIDDVVRWTHWCILRQKKVTSQIGVDSTDDEIDSSSYEIEVRGLDRKKTFYAATVPYDAWGIGTISNISSSFLPGSTEDDTKTRIIEPLGGSNINVTFDLVGASNGKVSWTKDIASDRNRYILEWRGVENTLAVIQPTQIEVDNGVTSIGNHIVISGHEIVNVNDNTGNDLNWHTLKDLRNGFKYWGRVKYVNKAGHEGDWSHLDDGSESWATHTANVPGVTADDLDWEFKKYIYEGGFSATNYNTVAWAKGADTGKLKFKKTNGTTTDYVIVDGNTGAISVPSYIVHPGDAPDANTKFKVIAVDTFWAGSTTGKTPIAYVKPASDTQEKAFWSRFSNKKDFAINSSFISALSIITGMLQAGVVTASKMSVTSLASITAILGSITAGDLTLSHDGGGFIKFKDSTGKIAIRIKVNSGADPDFVIMKSGENADNGNDASDPSKVAFSTKLTIGASTIRPSSPKIIAEGLAACVFADETVNAGSTRSDIVEIQTSVPLNNYFTLNVWISNPTISLYSTHLEWSDIIYIDSTGTVKLIYRAYYYPATGIIVVERKAINTTNVNRTTGAITYGARWVLYSDTV